MNYSNKLENICWTKKEIIQSKSSPLHHFIRIPLIFVNKLANAFDLKITRFLCTSVSSEAILSLWPLHASAWVDMLAASITASSNIFQKDIQCTPADCIVCQRTDRSRPLTSSQKIPRRRRQERRS